MAVNNKRTFIISFVISSILLLCIFLPFLPGDYDAFSVVLSAVAQMISLSVLIIIPIGIIWLIFQLQGKKNVDFKFSKIVLILLIVVCMAAALGAFIRDYTSLAIIILFIGYYFIRKGFNIINTWKKTGVSGIKYLPFFLIFMPVIVFGIQTKLMDSAIEFSRNRVIRNSRNLINDIEAYKKKNGSYPVSLLSIWEDYKPSIKSVNRYHYEINGNAFNIYFERFNDKIGTREIVMYNKFDQLEMTSHNQDLLQMAPQEILRGYHFSKKLSTPHWKYFLFD